MAVPMQQPLIAVILVAVIVRSSLPPEGASATTRLHRPSGLARSWDFGVIICGCSFISELLLSGTRVILPFGASA